MRTDPVYAPTLPSTRGLTLVEVLVTLFLLGVVFMCLVPLQTSSLRSSQKATELQKMALLLDSHLQTLRGLSPLKIPQECASRPWSTEDVQITCKAEPCAVLSSALQCPGNSFQAIKVTFAAWKQGKHLLGLQTVIAQ